jgi:hypothetical protein
VIRRIRRTKTSVRIAVLMCALAPLLMAREVDAQEMQYGSSAGGAAALMKPVVAHLSEDDIIAISSYLGSLPPQ